MDSIEYNPVTDGEIKIFKQIWRTTNADTVYVYARTLEEAEGALDNGLDDDSMIGDTSFVDSEYSETLPLDHAEFKFFSSIPYIENWDKYQPNCPQCSAWPPITQVSDDGLITQTYPCGSVWTSREGFISVHPSVGVDVEVGVEPTQDPRPLIERMLDSDSDSDSHTHSLTFEDIPQAWDLDEDVYLSSHDIDGIIHQASLQTLFVKPLPYHRPSRLAPFHYIFSFILTGSNHTYNWAV